MNALILSLLLPLGLHAQVRNPGTYVMLESRSWFTFDPAAANDAVSFIATGNVYEPLITFKSVGDPEGLMPFLASEVPSRENGLISQDGLTYTFPVRKDVVFHSGDPLTPEDVRYSLLRFMLHDPQGGSAALLLRPLLGLYSTRDSQGNVVVDFAQADQAVQVQDDKVILRLKRLDNTFLKILASLPIVVCRKWAVEHGEWDGTEAAFKRYNNRPLAESYLHEHMNGTGPFSLEKADAKAGELSLKRNPRYWRDAAKLEQVLIRVVPCPALRMTMLENGDADSSYFEARDYYEVKELSGVRIAEGPGQTSGGEVVYFTFKADPGAELLGSGRLDGKGIPPDFFSDAKVREGFAYALDYDAYLKRGLGGRGTRTQGPIPGCLCPSSKEKPRFAFDLGKAKKAFRAALGGRLWEQGFTVTLTYSPSNANRLVLAELLKEGVERLNPKFKVKVRAVTSQQLYSEAERHRLPVFIAGYYADYPDPHSYAFGMLHSSGYFPKAQRYANPQVDALIEKAAGAASTAERRDLYQEAVRLASGDVPQVYTFSPMLFQAGKDWVRGLDSDQNVSNLGLNRFPYFYVLSK
ncbi:MAG: ABC transporter substrate-binding protein [Elusimicrobiota bacterium]